MSNILVIGGAGYIGSVVCEKLVKKHKVIIMNIIRMHINIFIWL